MLTHTLLATLVILGVSASPAADKPRRRAVPYNEVYNGGTSSAPCATSAAAPSEAYGGLVSNGYGQGTHPTHTDTRGQQGGHETQALKTRIKAWQPQDGLFFVDEKKLEKTQAYIKDGMSLLAFDLSFVPC